ncbi:MAG: polysaccharide deacetylase family protein [Desulfovibrio sp.]|nr:polysaccharide deacetylase family protein [Desulfovibrio sp.]
MSCIYRVSFRLPLVVLFIISLLLPVSVQSRVISGSDMMDQNMEENLCALTFDDGPAPTTLLLLDLLKQYNIHATFFMLGQMVNHYPDIVMRVAEEGHEIASHTYSHKNLRRLSYLKQKEELERGFDSLASLGIIPSYLRPPYGSFNEMTTEIAASLGLDVVLWSMDSKDWKRLPDDYSKLVSVRGTVYEPGTIRGVFLFHDIHKKTVDDLPRIIHQLREAGCQRFVTFSEYMQGLFDPEPAVLMTRRSSRVPATETGPEGGAQHQALGLGTPATGEEVRPEKSIPAAPSMFQPSVADAPRNAFGHGASGASPADQLARNSFEATDPSFSRERESEREESSNVRSFVPESGSAPEEASHGNMPLHSQPGNPE